LPVVVAAWLCSYISVSDGQTHDKALHMLERLSTPLMATESAEKYFSERSHLMFVILSKMVLGLVPVGSPSRSYMQQPAVTSQNASRDVLVKMFRRILTNGCMTVDDVHRMDSLLTVGGPVWFAEHLVRALLTYDRVEDLSQGAGLLYALFHLDIDNLILALLNFTLPGLLTLQSATPTTVTVSASTSTVGLRLLTDPRGHTLAKLCVMCLNLASTTRQLVAASETGVIALLGKKPVRAEIQLEDWDNGDDGDGDIGDERLAFDGISDDGSRFGRKSRRQTFDDDGTGVLPLGSSSDDGFDLPVSDFLGGSVSASTGRRTDSRTRFRSKDLLSRSLVRLFRLMHSIMSDKSVSPRSAFVVSFIRETLKVGHTTARFILQFMPHSMASLLVRTLPNEFDANQLLYICDLATPAGRRTASKVIVQHARYVLSANAEAA
jgi:hypothetical protein